MSTKKTPVQEALLNLRKRLEMTQQDLAVALCKSVVTVCRWETVRPPSGYSLLQIAQFARDQRAIEIAEVLEQAVRKEGATPSLLNESSPLRIYWTNEKAAEEAFVSLRANRGIAAVRREYLKALRTLQRAHAVLVEQAKQGAETNNPWKYFQDVQEQLESELEYEEKRQKTKR